MDDSSDESVDYGEPIEEEDEMREKEKTTRGLGYRVQKELWFNRHLPYSDRIDDESEKLLELIKTNMAKALVHKEMNPGMGICSAQLMWYVHFICYSP